MADLQEDFESSDKEKSRDKSAYGSGK